MAFLARALACALACLATRRAATASCKLGPTSWAFSLADPLYVSKRSLSPSAFAPEQREEILFGLGVQGVQSLKSLWIFDLLAQIALKEDDLFLQLHFRVRDRNLFWVWCLHV